MRQNENVIGVFCLQRNWMLKAKCKNFQNKNVIHKSRLCIFTWKKTWQTVEIRYVDVNIWKIDPRCQVLKPCQMRDEWICQIMVNAVERSDCQPSVTWVVPVPGQRLTLSLILRLVAGVLMAASTVCPSKSSLFYRS